MKECDALSEAAPDCLARNRCWPIDEKCRQSPDASFTEFHLDEDLVASQLGENRNGISGGNIKGPDKGFVIDHVQAFNDKAVLWECPSR